MQKYKLFLLSKGINLRTRLLATLAMTSLITACSQKPIELEKKLGSSDVTIKGAIKEDLSELNIEELSSIKKWQHADLEDSSLYGVSADKAYTQFPNSLPPKEVIVAVIDSGVDIEHEDLKANIWINQNEIPGNGIDDDNNGYIDDINGWNYIGGVDGRNINEESLEETRVVKSLTERLANGEVLSQTEISELEAATAAMNDGLSKYKPLYDQAKIDDAKYQSALVLIRERLGITIENFTDIRNIESEDADILLAKKDLISVYRMYSRGPVGLARILEKAGYYVNIGYNQNFDARSEIVGDDPSDFTDIRYGNNDVKGPDSVHGTHVAGTIAAVRNNKLGMNGIADNVKIMALRAVPNGDERDKDIALAIRYAADNGAKIINMSFGKKFSPYKVEVDKAFEYAAKKGVIFFHSAGNSSLNNDGGKTSFPNSYKRVGTGVLKVNTIANWVEVGASTKDNNMRLAASFSNYGQESVTLFSPGHKIYATTPENTYKALSGTSMAAPVASGVAAFILGRYPDLKASELIQIIKASVLKASTFPVDLPGRGVDMPVMFSTLSATGGVINLLKAMQLAEMDTLKND